MLEKARPVLLLVAVLWLVEALDVLLGLGLEQYGIRPRLAEGLWGILWAPFLHAGFGHLIANTIPLFMLGWLASLGTRRRFASITLHILVLAGLGTWAIGSLGTPAERAPIHIGASSLVFGYFGFVVARALFYVRVVTLLLALVAVALYGGIVFGVLPTAPHVSWEGHLCGLLAGIAGARGAEREPQPDGAPPSRKRTRRPRSGR